MSDHGHGQIRKARVRSFMLRTSYQIVERIVACLATSEIPLPYGPGEFAVRLVSCICILKPTNCSSLQLWGISRSLFTIKSTSAEAKKKVALTSELFHKSCEMLRHNIRLYMLFRHEDVLYIKQGTEFSVQRLL